MTHDLTDEAHPATEPVHAAGAGLRRRSLLTGSALGAVSAAASAALPTTTAAAATAAAAPPAARSANGAKRLPAQLAAMITAWAQAPASHPSIGDWRRVGFHRGEKIRYASKRVVSATDYGIRPGQPGDVSGVIQRALEHVAATGGGVLQLKAGRYVLDNPIFVHDSGVVLRGAGKDQTTLYFSRPLQQSIGRAYSPDDTGSSGWSWNGGQIFFIARERLAASKASGWGSDKGAGKEGWMPGGQLAAVSPASRGSNVLLLDDTSKITAGAMVLLEVDNPLSYALMKEMSGEIAGADTYNWAVDAAKIAPAPGRAVTTDDLVTWRWPVVVSEILSPKTVRLEQPLRITLRRETPARLLALGPTVHDSGVEDLTIENKLLPQTAHNINPGSNGVCFQAVHDCWARNIHVVNADLAFGMTAAKSCTLTGISTSGRALHHFVACRTASHDNLVEDFVQQAFTTEIAPGAYHHGINLEGLSSGNVYRRGTLHNGTFDSHRALPFENLRTDITLTNKDAILGGSRDAGPYFGARTVHWGISAADGKNLGVDISDIAPRSLVAGITGLAQPGSGGLTTPLLKGAFAGDIETESIAFGVDLGRAKDLLDIQRVVAPLD